jgi:hypothetical protein
MNTRGLLVASLALVFVPLAPVAHAVSVTCELCVTISGGGHTDTICHPVPCPGAASLKLPYTEDLVRVPQGSPCSLRTPHGTTVHGQTSGRSCQLSRSLRPEELEIHR